MTGIIRPKPKEFDTRPGGIFKLSRTLFAHSVSYQLSIPPDKWPIEQAAGALVRIVSLEREVEWLGGGYDGGRSPKDLYGGRKVNTSSLATLLWILVYRPRYSRRSDFQRSLFYLGNPG